MFKLFDRCVDCRRVVWPWQDTGPDFQSHARCHAERMSRFHERFDAEKARIDLLIEEMVAKVTSKARIHA